MFLFCGIVTNQVLRSHVSPVQTGHFQAPHTLPNFLIKHVCMTSMQKNHCSVIIATIVSLCMLVSTCIFVCCLKLQEYF